MQARKIFEPNRTDEELPLSERPVLVAQSDCGVGSHGDSGLQRLPPASEVLSLT